MKNISHIQQKLLSTLKNNIDNPLTIRELQNFLDLSSPSLVQHHIVQLEKLGYLKRNPSNPRDYQIVSDGPEKLITYLNLYGLAQCGPNGSLLDGSPIDRIPISSKLLGFRADQGFMVKAKGTSMAPKINPGDLVIVQKSQIANNGDIVVCVNDGMTIIKKIKKDKDKTILISLNRDYEPFIASSDFRIEGLVKGILSYSIT